jgi:CheY-like chemotaxis protein
LTCVAGQVTFAISPLIRGKISLARKILLADDSVTAQNMGRKILADAGYEVITVNNGSAALKKIAELKPDLVILDVYMPGYSGLEVCQRLKESQETARIPVLLTVGKLEPFKPEESHRVRAEGFIVKPFEASELLAALSKLEDKVVPRAEPSKPGRFARAIAAAEESGRISRNDSAGDDNGWKSRISFPHEKTAEEKSADEAPVYNPVNRDLRTVVETPAEKALEKKEEKPEEKKEEKKVEQREQTHQAAEPSVDVAALAPAGLPKDVTPEEVAAIAAAAAQLQIAAAATQPPSSAAEIPASTDLANSTPAPNPQPQVVPVNAIPESIVAEHKEDSPGETFAVEAHRSQGDQKSDDSPVTMAAASGQSITAANGSASRWSAVAVALEAAETTISLDQEMRKAYAAFVAEETASVHVTTVPDVAPLENSSVPSAVAEPTSAAAISSPEPQPEPVTNAEASPTAPLQAEPSTSVATDSYLAAEPASFPEVISPTQSEAAFAEPIHEPVAESATAAPVGAFSAPIHEPVPGPIGAAETAALPQELSPAPEPVLAETTASTAPAEQQKDEQNQESESVDVKSTAAAWASWRDTRDTDSESAPVEAPSHESAASAPVDSAAMAVAAGAEQNSQETAPTPENPSDVASIVDSVLADLRPRLMAEITRKMSEKK